MVHGLRRSLACGIFPDQRSNPCSLHWQADSFYFFNFFNFLKFLAVLGLHGCVQAFSSCSERGLLFVAVCGLLIAVASLVVEHGL